MQLIKTESTTIWNIGKIQISSDECVQLDLTFLNLRHIEKPKLPKNCTKVK